MPHQMPELAVKIGGGSFAVGTGDGDLMLGLPPIKRRRHLRQRLARIGSADQCDALLRDYRILVAQYRNRTRQFRIRNELRAIRLRTLQRSKQTTRAHAA